MPEPEVPIGATLTPDGDIRLRVTSPAEAKLAIKQLRLMKKELSLEKRAVAAQMTEIRAERRLQVANQGSKVRGGGDFGKLLRAGQSIGRDMDRAKHANRLTPLEDHKARIETRSIAIDGLIAKLDAYLLEHAKADASTD